MKAQITDFIMLLWACKCGNKQDENIHRVCWVCKQIAKAHLNDSQERVASLEQQALSFENRRIC